MHKEGAGLCSYLTILFLLGAIGVRLYTVRTATLGVMEWVYYALVIGGVAITAFDCFRKKEYANAFSGSNSFHLDVFAAVAAVGFFVEFAGQCVRIYQSVENGSYHLPAYFIPKCVICAFALLSSFYYCAMAMSYHSTRYDIRGLKLFHVVPLLWAVSRMLSLIEQAEILGGNPNAVLKYASLVFALCFCYCVAHEIEHASNTRAATIFFSRAFSFVGELYFMDSLMLVFSGYFKVYDEDFLVSVSILLLCSFAFFFDKNIISKSTESN